MVNFHYVNDSKSAFGIVFKGSLVKKEFLYFFFTSVAKYLYKVNYKDFMDAALVSLFLT